MIRSVGWEVQELVKRSHANLAGALTRMGQRTLPMVLTVTAFDHTTAGTILIGYSQDAWDDNATQTKCLINSHLLCDNNDTVDDTTIRDGGKQR